jgi:hypothetical protein
MMAARSSLLIALGALSAGCQCKPQIPDATDREDETGEQDTTRRHTGDTAPPPLAGPCSIEEVEPNDADGAAMTLPLESYLCGDFERPGDFDRYQVVLPDDGWLGVYVDAQSRGSFADAVVAVQGPSLGAERDNDGEGSAARDAHLVIPAPAGTYELLLIEFNLNGNETDYFYELLATVAKDPFLGTTAEVEPNGTSGEATVVASGDRVEAVLEAGADQDWYQVAVPGGRHTVTVDVEAYDVGSPANVTLFAYEAGVAGAPRAVPSGVGGAGFDPYWTFESDGNETLWFRIEEDLSKGGPAWWYGFVVTVEAS